MVIPSAVFLLFKIDLTIQTFHASHTLFKVHRQMKVELS